MHLDEELWARLARIYRETCARVDDDAWEQSEPMRLRLFRDLQVPARDEEARRIGAP